jgi:predicted permease
MHNLLFNLRYALRQFRLAPVFTISAVLTLALGIGGTTAIFTLIHAVMLRSLPVSDPATLYRVGDGNDCCVEGGLQDRWGMYSFNFYQRLKDQMPEFEDVTAFEAGQSRMSVRRESESAARPLLSEYVTGSYFSTLGIRPYVGRFFTAQDDVEGAPPAAVLSHHAWQTDYGSDPSVVGSNFDIEGHSFTIIGVAPPGFFGETLRSDPPDIWIPVHQEPLIDGQTNMLHSNFVAWLRVIGRLRPGASVAGMAPRLTGTLRLWMQHDAQYPANWMARVNLNLPKQFIAVVPAGAGVAEMKEDYGRSLQILLAVCGLVLLIACANVANLLLARAVNRRAQTAVRLAMGASRRQIVLQALSESVLLAIFGGIAGLVIAVAAARLLLALAFHGATFLPISTAPSLLVLGFTFFVALLTGIIFGAAPAWFATRTDPAEALRTSTRSATGRSTFARKALLILQFSISVALVAGATMLARSLGNLESQNFGFTIRGRVLVGLHDPNSDRTQPQLTALYRELQDRLDQVPGVRSADLALYNPLTDNWGEYVFIAGHATHLTDNANSSWDRVSANYLQDLGATLLRGRYFTAADNENTAPVAIVNEAFVKHFFKPNEDPLGHHFGLDLPENANTYQIVGIVRDPRFQGFELNLPARPMFFVPLAQYVNFKDAMMGNLERGSHFMKGIMLQSNTPPGTLEPLVIRAISGLDPDMTVTSVRTLQQQLDLRFDQERAVASLAGLFGIVALLLAAVGLYGVTAYTVAQRTNEIGIRMALGADRASVVQLILRGAFQRVLIGLLVGIPLAIAAGRLIAAELYDVSSWDPLALTLAALALALCSFVAAVIPALRAASISPMSALRIE